MVVLARWVPVLMLTGCAVNNSELASECEIQLPDGTAMICRVKAEHDEATAGPEEIPLPTSYPQQPSQ